MAKFEKPDKGNNKGDDGDHKSLDEVREMIVEPRCPICMDKRRLRMDYLLAMRTTYKEMERLFSTDEKKIDYRSFSNHAKKHLNYEDSSVKQVLEYEAGLAGENLETGVRGGFLRRASLDISIKKYFEALNAGEIPVEAGDVIKMIELREKLDESSASAQIEQYELQFNAFKEALEQICPPEMLAKILDLTRVKLSVVERPALQPPDDEK